MEMEYCLTGSLTVVLENVDPVAVKHLHHGFCTFAGNLEKFLGIVIGKLEKIRCMIFWKDHGMSPGCRIDIKHYLEIVILINGSGKGILPY